MKRLTLVSALILAAALPVLAQNGPPYRFDNFDFADGVRVQLPAAPARRSRKDARGRKLVVSSNLSYSHSNEDIDRLLAVYDEVMPFVAKAVRDGAVRQYLHCEPLVPLFRVR